MPPHTDPQGRLKITSLLNPLNLISVLAGPNLARECFCCICVFVLFVAWIQILPAISSIITLLDKLPHQIEDNILWIMLAAVSACVLGCCRCYVKVKQHQRDEDDDDSDSSDDDIELAKIRQR